MKAIILAGGGGTRLWPLSTEACPKQFLNLISEKPMIVETIHRVSSLCNNSDVVVVTNEKYSITTRQILEKWDLNDVHVIAEPARRNTAPAIILALKYCIDVLKTAGNEPIIIFPCDHAIRSQELYIQTLSEATRKINEGKIVTLGVVPRSPDTGYGYIKAKSSIGKISDALEFKEKPDFEKAQQYLKEGTYYWNGGIYGFSYDVFCQELAAINSSLFEFVKQPYVKLISKYESIDAISIDCAVSEKSKNICIVPLKSEWSDIGSFKSYYDYMPKDEKNNVVIGNVEHYNCRNSLIINRDARYMKVSDIDSICCVQAEGGMIINKLV